MTRDEFHDLVQLQNKVIRDDLEFVADESRAPLMRLKSVIVANTGPWTVKLDGWYNPDLDSLSFTFSCAQVSSKPICRVDVRGPAHDVGGRTHKHELRHETCPRKNLPTRIERPELEAMTPQEVWQDLCERAQILHQGAFNDPR